MYRESLDEVEWHNIRHAYGSSEEVPQILAALCSDNQNEAESAFNWLESNAYHQQTHYEVNAAIVPFLLEIAADISIPFRNYSLKTLLAWCCIDDFLLPFPLESALQPLNPEMDAYGAPWRTHYRRTLKAIWQHCGFLVQILQQDPLSEFRCDAANMLGQLVVFGKSECQLCVGEQLPDRNERQTEEQIVGLLAVSSKRDPHVDVRVSCALNLGICRDSSNSQQLIIESFEDVSCHATKFALSLSSLAFESELIPEIADCIVQGLLTHVLVKLGVGKGVHGSEDLLCLQKRFFRYEIEWLIRSPSNLSPLVPRLKNRIDDQRQSRYALATLGQIAKKVAIAKTYLAKLDSRDDVELSVWIEDALYWADVERDSDFWEQSLNNALNDSDIKTRRSALELMTLFLPWKGRSADWTWEMQRQLYQNENRAEDELDDLAEQHREQIIDCLGSIPMVASAETEPSYRLMICDLTQLCMDETRHHMLPILAGWISDPNVSPLVGRVVEQEAKFTEGDNPIWDDFFELANPQLENLANYKTFVREVCVGGPAPKRLAGKLWQFMLEDPDKSFRSDCAEYLRCLPHAKEYLPQIVELIDGTKAPRIEACRFFSQFHDHVAPVPGLDDPLTVSKLVDAFVEDRQAMDGASMQAALVVPLCGVQVSRRKVAAVMEQALLENWGSCTIEILRYGTRLPMDASLIASRRAKFILSQDNSLDVQVELVSKYFQDFDTQFGFLDAIEILNHPNKQIVKNALMRLGGHGDCLPDELLQTVLKLLDNSDQEICRKAFDILHSRNTEIDIQQTVIERLESPQETTRESAAIWLGYVEPKLLISDFCNSIYEAALKHENVRLWARRLLVKNEEIDKAIIVAEKLIATVEARWLDEVLDWICELGTRASPLAEPLAIRMKRDPWPGIKFRCALVLTDISAHYRDEVRGVVKLLLSHPVQHVRNLGTQLGAKLA